MDELQRRKEAEGGDGHPIRVDENTKNEQLGEFTEDSRGKLLTTNLGVRVNHTDDSLKVGERGPTLMEDFHFREKMTHFDHERIPERVVHARGSGAHGYFQPYQSMAEYTKAKFLQDPNVRTPVFVRFSTVVGFRGSADTVRDVRGFATKFYTEEGNYDLVGNNIPVFFIHDAIKFPDLVHSIKPEQHNQIPQASAAHDTFWDFVVSAPENTHMIMWLLSDRGIPRSLRMMQGFGVNTFRFVNAEGKARFVKFHWKPMLGMAQLVWDEAQKIAGKDPDYHRRDLWEAIESGNYPEYELGVQIVEEADEHKFDFDILDATKFIPEEEVPVVPVGKMVLNRNPENFFAETEQVAFCPANVVPGIDFSNDPLLQGRLFSYLDTQLIRLGGPNFHEIPINRSVAPVHNNQREGHNRMTINKGQQSYSPNSVANNDPRPASEEEGGYVHYQEKVEGHKIRARSESFKDFYSQATLFWNSMTEPEKDHIVEAFWFEVGKVNDMSIKKRVVEQFNQVDGMLGRRIAEGLGLPPPESPGGTGVTKSSPAVSFTNFPTPGIKTRKIAVLLENGFNNTELSQIWDMLKGAGASPHVVSMHGGKLTSMEGDEVMVEFTYTTAASVLFDAVYIPGGEHVKTVATQGDAIHWIEETFKHHKPVGASSEGVDLLMECSLPGASYAGTDTEDELVSEMGVVTIRHPEDMGEFGDSFREAIKHHRHWARLKAMVPA